MGIFVGGRRIACGRIGELGEQLQAETDFHLESTAKPGGDALLRFLWKRKYIRDVQQSGESFRIRADEDVTGRLVKDLTEDGFVLASLRQAGNDPDEIYRRYFEKAGEQHAEYGTGGKVRILRRKKRS